MANTGAAFSLFENHGFLLTLISAVAVVSFSYYFLKNPLSSLFLSISWGLLLGGALGNLFDRIYYKCVLDFINIECLKFPVFNVADVSITIGAAMIFYYYLFTKEAKNV